MLAEQNKCEVIENLTLLAEGLILLMKRNFIEGLRTIEMVRLEKFSSIKEQ